MEANKNNTNNERYTAKYKKNGVEQSFTFFAASYENALKAAKQMSFGFGNVDLYEGTGQYYPLAQVTPESRNVGVLASL